MRDLLKTSFDSVVMVADERSLFDSAARLRPSIVVVDLALSQGDSIGMVTRWHERFPSIRLIVLSLHHDESVARTVMAAGASAYVLKRTIADDLLDAVDAVAAGVTYVSHAAFPAKPLVSPRRSSNGMNPSSSS